jgi:hypothetical protein
MLNEKKDGKLWISRELVLLAFAADADSKHIALVGAIDSTAKVSILQQHYYYLGNSLSSTKLPQTGCE